MGGCLRGLDKHDDGMGFLSTLFRAFMLYGIMGYRHLCFLHCRVVFCFGSNAPQ